MVADPHSKRVVSATQMFQPECNKTVTVSLERVIPSYPNVDCFIMDRNCKYKATGGGRLMLGNISTYAIDWWHAFKHCNAVPFMIWKFLPQLMG